MKDELLLAAKGGNSTAFAELTEKYTPLICSVADRYFGLLEGGSIGLDDLIQEAHMAFYRAMLSFDTDQETVSFGLYAKICIRNRMVSILRKNRSEKKHNLTAKDISGAQTVENSPRLRLKEISGIADTLLTAYEKAVFYMYLDGVSYKDIALSLGRTEKSVDNALFRAKAKLRSGCSM